MEILPPFLLQVLAAAPITAADLAGIVPVLILFGTASVVLLVDLFAPAPVPPAADGETRKPVLHFLSLLGAVLAGAQICGALAAPGNEARTYFLGALRVDKLALAMSLLIVAGAAISLLAAADSLRRRGLEHGEFHALILFAAGSMVLFVQSSSLVMAFLSLETLSMAAYVLSAYTRDEKRSVEGALKYFVLGGLSTGFLLLGLVFLFGATRSLQLGEIEAVLRTGGPALDVPLLTIAMALVVVGLAFKIGAFPFHSWLPDAYEGALTVVTGFMAVTVKVASFAVLLRLALLFSAARGGAAGAPDLTAGLSASLSTLAVATMLFGNFVAVVQTSVKRMLAYSAIAHTGYLLVAVVAALRVEKSPGDAILFYLLPYALMTLGAFTILSHLGHGWRDRETFDDLRGLGREQPALALGMLVIMVSFAGIPPTAGFWGKLQVFKQALDTGHWGLAVVGILTSVVAAYYYLAVVVSMYMQPAPGGAAVPGTPPEPRTCGRLAITLTVAAVALVGLFPDVFFKLSQAFAAR